MGKLKCTSAAAINENVLIENWLKLFSLKVKNKDYFLIFFLCLIIACSLAPSVLASFAKSNKKYKMQNPNCITSPDFKSKINYSVPYHFLYNTVKTFALKARFQV